MLKKTIFLILTISLFFFSEALLYAAVGDILVNTQDEFGTTLTNQATIILTFPGPDGTLGNGDDTQKTKADTGSVTFINGIDFNNGVTDIANGQNFKIESSGLGSAGYLNATIASTSWNSADDPNIKTILNKFTVKVTVKNEFGSEITAATANVNFGGTSGVRNGSTAIYGISKPVGSPSGTVSVTGLGTIGYLN
ncbi:MAG: hypothetical protein ABIG09_06420, partial [bacterium]